MRLFLFIVLASSAFITKAQTEKLVWNDWNSGYEKAQKENKIVLIDAYTDWCGWCKRMDKDTYANAEVIKVINQFFVPIKFNPEIPANDYKVGSQVVSNQQLYSMLAQGKSTGFPTTYYINPSKNTLMIDVGYKGPEDFLKILQSMIAESKK